MPLPAPPPGDLLKLEESHSTWKRYRDELDMFERHPRRWLRKHGQYRGLKMTLADKVFDFAALVCPIASAMACVWGSLACRSFRQQGSE